MGKMPPGGQVTNTPSHMRVNLRSDSGRMIGRMIFCVRHKIQVLILRTHCFMMMRRMMFGEIIGVIVRALVPVNVKLLLVGAIT